MAVMGNRQRRPSRVTTLKSTASFNERIQELLRDQSLFLRLSICLLGLLAMLLAVQAWQAPFRYRLGDRSPEGISARVGFQLENRAETERIRNEQARLVPHYFTHNSQLLEGLAAKLRIHLGEIAEARQLEELSSDAATAFGLVPDLSAGVAATASKQEEFATLKSSVSTGGTSVGSRIDELEQDFSDFIAPLFELGVVRQGELSRNQIDPGDSIAILSPEGEPIRTTVAAEVLLSEMIENTGQLGKSWNQFAKLVVIRSMLEAWLINNVPTTLRFDEEYTRIARQNVRAGIVKYDTYEKGAVLVQPGSVIDERQLVLLEAESVQIEREQSLISRLSRLLATTALLLLLGILMAFHLVHNERTVANSARHTGVYLATVVVTIALARILSYDPWRAEMIPILFTTMVIAIAYNQLLGVLTAFVVVLVVTASTVGNIGQFIVCMGVAAAAILPLSRVSSRSVIVKIGFIAACVYFVIALSTSVVQSQEPIETWLTSQPILQALKGAGWCLVAGYLVAGSLPFLESAFGFVTDISLLELSDVSHPLLQELVTKAPGTYNHSISVATIGEAAADRIGANGLLLRVGAYFHDVGKMLKPQYFIENMNEQDKGLHDRLAPAMSTLIIIGHVKDGVDLARQHNLPERLIDFIEQHHGTTLVEYFYREATRQAEFNPDHKTDAEESSFRYPGPKPQTREAGVLMLADAVESASRSLSDPTPKRIESLVRDLLMGRLLDGQFDECSLTLNELRIIESSLVKSLIAIYHSRIKYPEQKTA